MHLLDLYSLSTGSKVGNPFIFDKPIPLAADKYIALQPFSKYQSKSYDYWNEVTRILKPILDKYNISVVQVGGAGESQINHTINLSGQTNFNQLAYIIKNSLLHVGVDSVCCHIKSVFGGKIVALYSNNFISNVKPYWTSPEDCVLLEPDRGGDKPVFTAQEIPKSINNISPELVASSICKLMGWEYDYPYTSIYNGDIFIAPMLETAMFDPINIEGLGISNIICRMDFNFNEDVLAKQLIICPCSIVTNKPIKKDLLNRFKPRLKEVVYFIEENNHAFDFYDDVIKLGVPLRLISGLPSEVVNSFKIDYMEIGAIQAKPKVDIDSILSKCNCQFGDLYYNSSKFTIGKGGVIYPSRAAMLANLPVGGVGNMNPAKVIDTQDFKDELLHFRLFTK
jgi:hypothetical protein